MNTIIPHICKDRTASLLLFCIFFFQACNNQRDEDSRRSGNGGIWFDYQVTAEEGNDNLTILLRYRDGGEEEDPIRAKDSAGVTLDGEVIRPEKTGSGNIFYEAHKPIDSFAGDHIIVFKGPDGKNYKEEFNFQPVRLLTVLPDTIKRGDLEFEFEGVKDNENMRILLTDTSFINDGINRLDRIKGGKITITAKDLERLANGPVQVEFIREIRQALQNDPEEGGRLLISYTLRRQFFLVD